MNEIRIAVSGSHGIGKTTLVNKIATARQLPMINEVVRDVAKMLNYATTAQILTENHNSKLQFQSIVFNEQIGRESNYAGFVSDRSVFDPIAYGLYYGLSRYVMKNWQEQAIKHSSSYDVIIYCPIPEESIEDDGFRLMDKEGEQAVDNYISALLSSAKCKVWWLSNDREKWSNEILQNL